MTRVIKGNKFVPVTLLEVPNLRVVWVKTMESDWYNALVVGILRDGAEWNLKENRKTLSSNEFSVIKEVPLDDGDIEKYSVWDVLGIDTLEWVEIVELTGISKWKGFAWVMKRYNFSGWPASHGSRFHRLRGSIGPMNRNRVDKGKKMAGHMWVDRVTLKKVPLELVNKDLSVIWVRGPVPGARHSLVTIKF